MPGGMQGFGFGTGNLGNLDNKVSLDRELELIEKDVYPNSEFLPPGQVNLISFFAQNQKFMMYHGNTTFGDCTEAVYLISTDLAAFSKNELYDIDQHKAQSPFQSKSAAQLKVPIYKNYDPPKHKKERPGLKQKAKPEEPNKPKNEPKPSGKPVQDTNKPMDGYPKDQKLPAGEPPITPTGQGNSKQAAPQPQQPPTASNFKPQPYQPQVIPPNETPKIGKLPKFAFGKDQKPFEFKNKGDIRDGPTLHDYAVHPDQKQKGPTSDSGSKGKGPPHKPTIQEMYQKYLKIPKNPYKRGSQKAKDFEKTMEEMKKQDKENHGSGTESHHTHSSSSSLSESSTSESTETHKEENETTSNKFVIYRPPPGQKIGWIPNGAIMPGKEVKDLNIEAHNQIYFPPLKNKKLKWGTIFYYKKDGEEGHFLPYIIKIPKDITVPQNAPFFTIPVWDKYSKEFLKVTFHAPGNSETKEPIKAKAKPVEPITPEKNDPNNIQIKLNYGVDDNQPEKKVSTKEKKDQKKKSEERKKREHHEDNNKSGDRMFKTCDDGIEMMNGNPSQKLKRQLKDLCGIETGERIDNYVPGLGNLGSKLGKIGSFWHRN